MHVAPYDIIKYKAINIKQYDYDRILPSSSGMQTAYVAQ